MTGWNFDSGSEGWTVTNFSYDGAAHCLMAVAGDGVTLGSMTVDTSIDGLSIPYVEGSPISFKVRFVGYGDDTPMINNFVLEVTRDGLISYLANYIPFTFLNSTDDSGWLTITDSIGADGTISKIRLAAGVLSGQNRYTIYFDSVSIGASVLTHSAGGIPGLVLL